MIPPSWPQTYQSTTNHAQPAHPCAARPACEGSLKSQPELFLRFHSLASVRSRATLPPPAGDHLGTGGASGSAPGSTPCTTPGAAGPNPDAAGPNPGAGAGAGSGSGLGQAEAGSDREASGVPGAGASPKAKAKPASTAGAGGKSAS